jgi:hypothetical protein
LKYQAGREPGRGVSSIATTPMVRRARRDDALSFDVPHHHIPDRGAFGAFIDAGPTGDILLFRGIERLTCQPPTTSKS